MTENLPVILTRMKTLMDELDSILIEEVKQLSRPQINPVSLQVISDNKSRLLSTINFYDEQRKHEEKKTLTEAPYPHQEKLATLWENISQLAKKSSELNYRSFQLLEMHMRKVNALKNIVKQSGASLAIYGESGQSNNNHATNTYRISI